MSGGVAHLAGAAMVVLALALPMQRRPIAMLAIAAAQAGLLAVAALVAGIAQGAAGLLLAGLVIFVVNAVVIPTLLRRGLVRTAGPPVGRIPAALLGLACVVLSVFVVLPAAAPSPAAVREDLALALATVLLGLLAMAIRHDPVPQAIGFLALGNGLVLAALGVGGLALPVELAVALPAVLAAVVVGAGPRPRSRA